MLVALGRAKHLMTQLIQNQENVVLSLNNLAHFSVCLGWLGLSGQVTLEALLGLSRRRATLISIWQALELQLIIHRNFALIILFIIIKLLGRSFGLAVDLVCIIII